MAIVSIGYLYFRLSAKYLTLNVFVIKNWKITHNNKRSVWEERWGIVGNNGLIKDRGYEDEDRNETMIIEKYCM